MSGGEPQTTNNRMELTGVITALEALNEPCVVELYPTQVRHRRPGKGLGQGWKARGWVKGTKARPESRSVGPPAGPGDRHQVKLHWVKGHASNPYNNRCDELAVAESRKYK